MTITSYITHTKVIPCRNFYRPMEPFLTHETLNTHLIRYFQQFQSNIEASLKNTEITKTTDKRQILLLPTL